MKAILIARVSTEEQREAGNSLPAQVARLERYCQRKNFEIIYNCSFDESAYGDDRSKFDDIIDLILAQKEKIVVCCDKVDRLSRNVFDKRISLLYEKALNDEIELHFVSDGQIITSKISAVEKFQFSISLGLAKYYSDAISDNVKRAQEQKIRKGEWLSKAPYGYSNVKDARGNSDVVVDEYASHIVKTMFELYASGAFSMNTLREKLHRDFGILWPKGSIAKMLNNPFYYGVMLFKGKEYPHRYTPIITKELFDEVKKILHGLQKAKVQYRGQPYFYRGLIRCGHCDMMITPQNKKNKYVYYHCHQFKGKHGGKWLREEELTRQFGEVFKAMQMPEHIVEEIQQTLNTVQEDKIEFAEKQFQKLTQEQKSINNMIENLYMDKLKGSITESAYDTFYQKLRTKLEDVSMRLEQLQEADEEFYITSRYILELVNRAHELFESSEVEERRLLIKLVLQNIKLVDEKIVWELHKPFDLLVKSGDCLLWRG